jgi:ribosomal protein S18 acetylase RimI-like enzyme
MIRFEVASDILFAKKMVRENMDSYYEQYGIVWNDELFDKSWTEFDNVQIYKDNIKVGVLSLWKEFSDLYIRDLQISQTYHNQGIGTNAVEYAKGLAKFEELEFLKLRVFETNPAKELYKRLGFKVSKHEGHVISMELEIA